MKALTFGTVSAGHSGGTKSYHVAWLACPETGKSILMKRWGKTDQFGQVQVEQFQRTDGATVAGDKVIRSKLSRGYRETKRKTSGLTQTTTGLFFGEAVWRAFGAVNLEFLDADIPVDGMKRDAPPPKFDEDGHFLGETRPRLVEVDPEVVRREELERQTAENAANPLFGMF